MAFKESEIQKMMKNLDLTREEAIQLLQDDEDDVSVELTAEQKKVVKSMCVNAKQMRISVTLLTCLKLRLVTTLM